jgi:hypothetical protein
VSPTSDYAAMKKALDENRAMPSAIMSPAVQKAMEQAVASFQKGLAAVINTALKHFADARTQARRHAVPAIFGPGGDGDADGKTFGNWLLTVAPAGGRSSAPFRAATQVPVCFHVAVA